MKVFFIMLFFFVSQVFTNETFAAKKIVEKVSQAAKPVKFKGGKIFEINSNKKQLLFTLKAELKKPQKDVNIFISSYIDLNKNEILTEEAHFLKFDLQKYIIDQKQLNEKYELQISEGKMHFTVQKDGKTEAKTRDLPSNLVVGPSFVPFLQSNWTEIQAQKKVGAQLAVLDFMDTFSFEFQKIRDEKFGGDNAVLVRMKPESSLVSSVVRPVYFLVKADGSKILELKGRMLPKRKVGSRWEDLEAEAVFTY